MRTTLPAAISTWRRALWFFRGFPFFTEMRSSSNAGRGRGFRHMKRKKAGEYMPVSA